MITCVIGGNAGSEGKGKIAGYLAQANDYNYAIDNFMTNTGHTYQDSSIGTVVVQQLPISLVNKQTSLLIGPGAAITPAVLFSEILKYKEMLGCRTIYIHPNAVVISAKHRHCEEDTLRSGSTFKGCGAASAAKIMRREMLFGDFWKVLCLKFGGSYELPIVFSSEYDDLNYCTTSADFKVLSRHIQVIDTLEILTNAIDNGDNILVEGSQGSDLDINYGLAYPFTTSRQCTAGQAIADCGLSPCLNYEVIMVIRPYPIRISNAPALLNNDVSTVYTGDYAGSEELSWEIIRDRCGAPKDHDLTEMSTVTKKPRRVFEMNWERLKYVTKLNRPSYIALNFAQYIDWGAYKCCVYDKLPQTVKNYVERIQQVTGVPVKLIGTGPDNNDIVVIR